MRRKIVIGVLSSLVLVVCLGVALTFWTHVDATGEENSTAAVSTSTVSVELSSLVAVTAIETLTTELSVSTLTSQEDQTITQPTEEGTQAPCRTIHGIHCKKWVYYGETISG